jgi:4-hydroxy-tetrahydrodipicolinate reductase
MRIGVAGIAGRMGVQICRHAILAGASLAGGTLRPGETPPENAPVFENFAALVEAFDFTHADAVAGHASVCAETGIGWVLGTTGLSARDQDAVRLSAASACVVQAANFAPGVVLVQVLARQLGAALAAESYDAEIVEMHHRQKVDAPSGTALALGRAVASGRDVDFDAVAVLSRQTRTGPRRTGDIGFAALRGGQVIGDHSVIFAGEHEHITLSHRALDRGIFAAGAVRAALWTRGKPAGLYGMEDVLGIGDR